MDVQDMGWSDMDWIALAKDSDRWWAFINVLMNLWVT
jgi:hypothetical protein